MPGGTYTLTGPGSVDIGPISGTVDFPSAFTVTNWGFHYGRKSNTPLTFNWTSSGVTDVQVGVTSATNTDIAGFSAVLEVATNASIR
jgi:hypothetical protein